MWVSVPQTPADLLVVLVVINFHQPSAARHSAKSNTVPLPSLIARCWNIRATENAVPLPFRLSACQLSSPAFSAAQIHIEMPPNASMSMIKRTHLLGKPFGQTYLGADLIISLQHWAHSPCIDPLCSPLTLFANCV